MSKKLTEEQKEFWDQLTTEHPDNIDTEISIYISGIQQRESIDYVLSGQDIVFSNPPARGEVVRLFMKNDRVSKYCAADILVRQFYGDGQFSVIRIPGVLAW